MSKSLEHRISILEKALQREKHKTKFLEKSLKILTGRIPKEIPIPKNEVSKLVKENKSTKIIAKKSNVSERTIYRRINKYGLKGLRPRGRKPSIIKEIILRGRWVSVQSYMNKLNIKYNFRNINYPRARFINNKTLVCSNNRSNPIGLFTTVGIYYIVKNSDEHFVYRTSVRFSGIPVPFEGFLEWLKKSVRIKEKIRDIRISLITRIKIIFIGIATVYIIVIFDIIWDKFRPIWSSADSNAKLMFLGSLPLSAFAVMQIYDRIIGKKAITRN